MENQDNQSTSFSTIEVLLKDINQHIPIILIKEDTFTINYFVRGYHAYIDIGAPKTGDIDLEVTPEEEKNEHDKFAVAIYHDKRVVGHAQKKHLSKPFYQFLSLPSCSISCEVTGKRVNRVGGYGLEIPVKYKFIGPEKAINWMKTQVNKKVNDIVKKTEHCMS